MTTQANNTPGSIKKNIDLTEALLETWKTANQITVYLVKNIPPRLWEKRIPGYPRKTVGMLAVHIHNVRYMWIKSIGKATYRKTVTRIAPMEGTRKELLVALTQSSDVMLNLLKDCIENRGLLPFKPAWLNFPNDVMHLLTYFVAHEAHHRGQIIMAARQLNTPLPADVITGLWQWTRRIKEVKRSNA